MSIEQTFTRSKISSILLENQIRGLTSSPPVSGGGKCGTIGACSRPIASHPYPQMQPLTPLSGSDHRVESDAAITSAPTAPQHPLHWPASSAGFDANGGGQNRQMAGGGALRWGIWGAGAGPSGMGRRVVWSGVVEVIIIIFNHRLLLSWKLFSCQIFVYRDSV